MSGRINKGKDLVNRRQCRYMDLEVRGEKAKRLRCGTRDSRFIGRHDSYWRQRNAFFLLIRFDTDILLSGGASVKHFLLTSNAEVLPSWFSFTFALADAPSGTERHSIRLVMEIPSAHPALSQVQDQQLHRLVPAGQDLSTVLSDTSGAHPYYSPRLTV